MSRMADLDIDLQDEENPTTLGGRIRFMRKLAKLTQNHLAKRIDKSRPSIVQYEAGNISPPLSVIYELAEIFKCAPEYLAFGINIEAKDGKPSHRSEVPLAEFNGSGLDVTEEAALPLSLIGQYIDSNGLPKLLRLGLPAPGFGLSKDDLLLVDFAAKIFPGDGGLYAIATSAGLGVMRNTVQFASSVSSYSLLDGHGQTHTKADAPDHFGRVVAALVRA